MIQSEMQYVRERQRRGGREEGVEGVRQGGRKGEWVCP